MAGRCARSEMFRFIVLSALASCSTLPTAPRDISDEHTGATVTVVGSPLTFSGEPNIQTSHNYLTLVALQRDEQGKFSAFLLLYHWSAFYGARPSPSGTDANELLIDVDGQSIDLKPLPALPAGLPTAKDLFVPDMTAAALSAYPTDLATLRQIALSHTLTLRTPKDPLSGIYELDDDGRPALKLFVEHLSAR